MMTINAQTTAQVISKQIYIARVDTNSAMERLSSGKRLNSAKDDASGVGISYQLMAQVRGANMSIRNAQDGISAAQIADAALVEVQNMAVRIRELAVQKASGQFTDLDKANVQVEIAQLNEEIQRISRDTKFNTKLVSAIDFQMVLTGTNSSLSLEFPEFPETAGTTAGAADSALESIATARAKLGAFVNRLDHAMSNLRNISVNTSMAYSRIVDADMALESANMAKGQVLQQTGSAMLAQANASNQYILDLIQ